MKRLTMMLTIFATLLVSSTAFAIPAVVPVQGVLTDSDGAAIDGDTPITFTFYDGGGTSLWTETFSVSVENGFFAVGLGAGNTALDLTIFEQNDAIELGIKVGSDDEMSPRMDVGAVPFAARSTWSDEAFNAAALEGQTLADLDTRFIEDAADTVDSSNIVDGTITTADVSSPVELYVVDSLFCEQEAGTVMNKDWCYARQDAVSSCGNSCSVSEFRVRQCDGSCGCRARLLCPIGVPCDPRGSWPRCSNQPVLGNALP